MKGKQLKKAIPYSKISLSGEHLTVRAFKFSDYKICCVSNENRLPKVDKFDEPDPVGREIDYNTFKERVLRYRSKAQEKYIYVFGVFESKSGQYVGKVDLFVINQNMRWGNLGYHIQNQYFNKGYGTEAAKISLKIAFDCLNFRRIEAGMELDHIASKKVAMKAGLEFEGIRKNFLFGGDMEVYAANPIDFYLKKTIIES